MSISEPDALIGAIALESVLSKLSPHAEDLADFRGAFHVLSGFTADQLVGFVRARETAGNKASLIRIQFPETLFQGQDLNPEYLTRSSSVGVRNQNRGDGLITIAVETEPDEAASLADSDTTDISHLKGKAMAPTWVEFVATRAGISLLPEDRRKLEAMLKGLFSTGRCPITKAGEFLAKVLVNFHNGEPLNRAAGKALPVIGLPLFEDCFSSLNETKMVEPSQWASKFKGHYALEFYLDKRGLNQDLLDPQILRSRLAQLRSDEQQPPVPEPVLLAFDEYIESEGSRNSATEHLLFDFDWNYTSLCFDRAKKSSAKDFAQRTRGALEAEAITPTPDDEMVLHALTKIARKAGAAPDEFREFFERRADALEKEPSLYLEWEDFVRGKKIECVDLFHGIFVCIQRSIRGLSEVEGGYVVLEGRQQKKPNNFIEMNQRACEYFERAYGNLEALTNKKIRFLDTLVCNYSEAVLPKIKDKRKFKGSNKSGKATTLNFLVSVFQERPNGAARKVVTLALAWKFPIGSVLAQEAADLDAISRYQKKRGSSLVECVAEYEVVGRKGLPVSVSLESTEGFADAARGGGRGAFIPAQDRIKSLATQWKETLHCAGTRSWLLPEQLSSLSANFDAFHSVYGDATGELRKSALATEKVSDVAEAYKTLLLDINGLKHQDARRQLLRIILRVGLAQVQRSGHRPPLAVICPWHPLRMEAASARQQQILKLIDELLSPERPAFSDGATGSLFFREVEQLLAHPLYPEVTGIWESTQCFPRVAAQALGSYTLHQPPAPSGDDGMPSSEDDSSAAAATIEHEMVEYLRLQPHERDNFSILLYNCESAAVPTAVVKVINRMNTTREDDKITCEVLLMHRKEDHLRRIYRDLVAGGVDTEADPTEASGDFLAKVRVNITAANRLRREGRSQPVDLAYCRDLISGKAETGWEWLPREIVSPRDLQPHQWSRRLPVADGERRVQLQLACPAQTEAGWAFLYSLAILCANGADDAWLIGKCPVLMRSLDFDNRDVERIFRETHDLATWVVNQDEVLDRRLLEAQENVKVIRYVRSATHGRNLIISSAARETLLVNTLKEKLKALLPSETSAEVIAGLCQRILEDANKISGGLVLKAARRANNTNELMGMVLTRYLVQSEIGSGRPIAWCFLDDYSQWLGKREGANIADLLVLAPKVNADSSLHLDVIVTEAKFVNHDGLRAATSTSAKQLTDTLVQLTQALNGAVRTIDQDIWLARLSDLLVSQTVVAAGEAPLDTAAWRGAIRERRCSVQVWGYSHIFVNEPQDLTAQVSLTKGIPSPNKHVGIDALQEVFGPGHVRELLHQFRQDDYKATAEMRLRNGHPPFGKSKLYHLASGGDKTGTALGTDLSGFSDEAKSGTAVEPTTGGAQPQPKPSTGTVVSGVQIKHDTSAGETKTGPADEGGQQAADEKPNSVIAFLEARAALVQTSEEEGRAWLDATTGRLRQALLTRGLPAKLVEGHPPILTPNSGIIKLQGSKDLTVQAVESRSDEIFTSEGIKIISTTPESGRVSVAVERPKRQVLHTEPVLLEYLKRFNEGTLGEKICVGIREEDGLPLMLDPLNQPHTLVAGITGSGKSVLMQNLILSIAATRSPDEAHVYLIDPKFGVDYRPLDELPHVELGSGGIIDDASAAIQVLEGLVDEMDRRYALFKHAKVPNVAAYRKATKLPLPTLWIFHDEFADWMQTEEYREAVPNIVGRLSVKARAAGIFLIFAAQRPDKDVMPMQLRSQLGNRLILKVDNTGTAEIAMGVKNSGAERLLGRGHMLAKTGDMPDAVFVQVPFIDMEQTIPELVRLIRVQHGRAPEAQP